MRSIPHINDVLEADLCYAGVGYRKTPVKILDIMEQIARKLTEQCFVLRSGGAIGADKAFARGAHYREVSYASDATIESMAIAEKYHPTWSSLSEYSKKLHGRNAFQVLGPGLDDYSKFIICWTRDGAISHQERGILTGGTGTSISIASEYGIPVFNLKRQDHLERILKWIK